MERLIRVLVVDDSALMRKMIKAILDTDKQIEVVGAARDGEDALKKTAELRPDVITMDINMPVMDGITSMMLIFEQQPEVKVVMLSSLTQEGAITTFEALELGAFDFVAKPSGTVSSNIYNIGKELIAKVKAAAAQRTRRRRPLTSEQPPAAKSRRKRPAVSSAAPALSRGEVSNTSDAADKLVVIGVSTGGPSTLMQIIPKIPADLDAAVIIVQHMPSAFTNTFARRLDEHSQISIREARAGDRLLKGTGLVVPGGFHLVLKKNAMREEAMVRITSTANEETLFIPSVDVTMRSAVEYFGKKVVGVLLTGMGADGVLGMQAIKEAGGFTIAEDESTAIVWGMPREAIERGAAMVIAPAHTVAREIVRAVKRI